MKKNKSVYILAVLIVWANCSFAQKKLASDKPMSSFYSQKTQTFLVNKQTAPGAAAMAKPGLTSQKSSQELMQISKSKSLRSAAHPNNNLPPQQQQKLLPSSTITMAQFSNQSLSKRNKAVKQF
jgi:hypothetical protein